MDSILITGTAGFIGFHLAKRYLTEGIEVIGYDNVNDYYGTKIKEDRLAILSGIGGHHFIKGDLQDKEKVFSVFRDHGFDKVCHLAAQAGVRYSLTNPHAYIDSNLIGFMNILEACRKFDRDHLVYASSSSVYGGNTNYPFSVEDNVDKPISLYAATKKSNELMAHVYSHLFGIRMTGLRFFTVYGPYGRPDMALFLFTRAITEGKPINVFNHGRMERDFTYIDDIVDGVMRSIERPFPYEVFNLGNNSPVQLEYFISVIERELGMKAKKNYMDIQPGDVPKTYADIDITKEKLGWSPKTSIEEGIRRFIQWYREYYMI
ncbi:MAG: NAD-dependent epimerase [Candidatus Thermoplasmatota archaeon]|nr:NAD-dependent epimerase [Candidatus Thermoplasmatota archaeon]